MRAALVISERDNVATALQALEPGGPLEIGGKSLTVREAIPSGHKIALHDIAVGQAIVKYGSPIGVATAPIAAGAHVHTHNVASNKGRGDLATAPLAAEPRLAEPQ